MNVKDLIADSQLAFLNGENKIALALAKKAVQLDKRNPDAYKCEGNAYLSMEEYDNAVKSYRNAVRIDPNRGDRYFDLGFALASGGKLAEALEKLTKADELGCSPEVLAQLYNLMGIICFEARKLDDAIVNLTKAEKLIGIDMDILQRKAIIYGMKNDYRNALHTANQIKLVTPSDYTGYNIAFKVLIQAKQYDTAQKELEKAKKFANLTMEYYFDEMTLELELYKQDGDKRHFYDSLQIIEMSLKNTKPSAADVSDAYINAAEIYLQLEDGDKTISCLNAAKSPVEAFNNEFEIIDTQVEEISELTEYDIDRMYEEDIERIEEEYGEYGLEEEADSIEADEYGNREYFTELYEEDTNEEKYFISESEAFQLEDANEDQINRLFVGAYTIKKDFKSVINYAKVLQGSEIQQNAYMGMYAEVNAMKELNMAGWKEKYKDIIKFFRNCMIKDPTDIVAITMRIQCNIDIGEYEEAETLCNLLSAQVKEPLLRKIKEEKEKKKG